MRPLAIELAFDSVSQRRLSRVWSDLSVLYGGPSEDELGVCPHITLALFRDREPGDLTGPMMALARQLTRFNLDLTTVDHFHTSEGGVFLRPLPSPDLAYAHSLLQGLLGPDRDLVDRYYVPAAWQPHCTMAVEVPGPLIDAVISACSNADARGQVSVERVHLVRYRPATEVCGAALEKAEDV